MSQIDDELDDLLMAYDLDNVDTNAKLTSKVISEDEAIKRYGELQTNFLADLKQLIGRERIDQAQRDFLRHSLNTDVDESLLIAIRNKAVADLEEEYGLEPEK